MPNPLNDEHFREQISEMNRIFDPSRTYDERLWTPHQHHKLDRPAPLPWPLDPHATPNPRVRACVEAGLIAWVVLIGVLIVAVLSTPRP